MERFVWYLIIINIIAFFMFGWDKQKARMNQWRISESTLLAVAFVGGSVGSYIGMKVFHHKTKKLKFCVGVPVIFMLQVVLLFIILC